jgi:hypothetical protein
VVRPEEATAARVGRQLIQRARLGLG